MKDLRLTSNLIIMSQEEIEREAERIRSSKEYQMMSNAEKLLVIMYFMYEKGENPFLPRLGHLSKISKPSIYRTFRKIKNPKFKGPYIKTHLVKVEKDERSRGPKYSRKIEFSDNKSEDYARRLYNFILK